MSRETTLARAAARHADTEWARHAGICAQCAAAERARFGPACCDAGAALRLEQRSARAEVTRNRELDAQPIDGQGALWE